MNNRKLRVAITQGDTNGVGYELIFKTFAEQEMLELCTPIIYGSPKVATYHRKALDMQASFSIISDAADAADGKVNLLTCFEEEVKVELGTPTAESGSAARKALDRALDDWDKGVYDVLVTAPVNAATMAAEGETAWRLADYLEERMARKGQSLSVMLNEALRVAVVTSGMDMKAVSDALTGDFVSEKAKAMFRSLKRDFRISNPRMAVLALNPDANGEEEVNVLKPAVEQLVEQGTYVFGPFKAEELFGTDQYDAFDGILAMYHDQGAIPFRTLVHGDGIRYVANLPVVCTTTVGDAQFGIAGKGEADEMSFRHAIYTAMDIFRNRETYDEPYANPLPKLYHEKRDESEKVRFSIPKKHENAIRERQHPGPAKAHVEKDKEAQA